MRDRILDFLDRSGIEQHAWHRFEAMTTDELIELTLRRTAELIADLDKRIRELEDEREGT